MITCDFMFSTLVGGLSKSTGEICQEPAVVKYEGHSDSMSWVGYRCNKHNYLADTLKITKLDKS